MQNEFLKEDISIPTLGGILVAEFGFKTEGRTRARKEAGDSWQEYLRLDGLYRDRWRRENYEFRWKLNFNFDGTNGFYSNTGIAFPDWSIPTLIRDFESALDVIRQLSASNFDGIYNKRIGEFENPLLEVTGTGRGFGLRFTIFSNNRGFPKTLQMSDVTEALDRFRYCLVRGPQLLDTLMAAAHKYS